MKSNRTSSLLLLSASSCLFLACGDDTGTTGTTNSSTETGTGTGDGDGDEDMTTNGDGDGDGDGDSGDGDGDSGDGDGDSGDGDGDTGDGDGDTGDGDGDTGDGDGDGDTGDGDGDTGDGDGDGGGFCGDGQIDIGEVCDDGVNDDSYGSCTFDCMAFGPNCGDGEVNGPETCDDGNDDATDGCIGTCVVPNSCLTIFESDNLLPSGTYLIVPDNYNGGPFEVHCDMVSDGGGYTFLKLTDGQPRAAADAENNCNGWGMNLWIPRSVAHKDAGWAIANNAQIGPDASVDYMRILGIYPDFNGATCANQPMNSSNNNCGWGASDGQAWYVHSVNNISEPNGDNNTTGSMYYQWNNDGSIAWHNDIGGQGYTSNRWMCDIGDKLP